MAPKPLRTCAMPGCPELVSDGSYCEHHMNQHPRAEDYRLSARKRGYDRRWERIRDQYIKAHPYCQRCGSQYRLHVHHVVPLSQGGTHDWSNLVSLCEACHNSLTAAESNRQRARGVIESSESGR